MLKEYEEGALKEYYDLDQVSASDEDYEADETSEPEADGADRRSGSEAGRGSKKFEKYHAFEEEFELEEYEAEDDFDPEAEYDPETDRDAEDMYDLEAASDTDGSKAVKEEGFKESGSIPASRSKEARKVRRKAEQTGDGLLNLSGGMGLAAAFLMPVLVMILVFVQRGIFPFGDKSFLRTDMYHQYAPFFSEFQYKLTHGGSLLYSWDVGLGVNFSALFAYYLASPLNWLLVLCPKQYVIEFMTYMIVLKIGLSGLSFTYYLHRRSGRSDFGAAFFGIFYALSGYMAAYSWNIMWLDCILLFPLVMLGLENLVKKRRGILYCVCLGLCILSNYYISIMICIFMVIYFAALLILEHRRGKGLRDYAVNIVQFGGCSLAAGGLAAVVLLPEIYALQATASSDFNFPKTFTSYFSIFDMFARHIGNVEVEIGLDHWPNIYCGVAVLMFFLLYLGCKQIPVKHKAVYVGMMLFFFASFSMNTLNFIWHGFHYPNSLPCRQSFIYIFLMLYVCYEAYSHLHETDEGQIGRAFFGSVVFVILAEKLVEQEHFKFYVFYLAIILLAVYAGLVWLYKQGKMDLSLLLLLALTVVTEEAATNTMFTSVTTTSRSAYIRDNEDVRTLVEQIPSDEGFYRIEKVTRKTKNDGAWMNFPTVSLFSSTANADLTAFVKTMGCEGSVNAYSITGSTPLVDSLLDVRYGLYSEEQDTSGDMLQLVGQSGDTWLYKRYFTLPLGYMFPDYFDSEWVRDQNNPALVQNAFCEGVGAEHALVDVGGENMGDNFRFTADRDGDYYVYISNKKAEKVEVSRSGDSQTFDNVNRGYLLEIGWCRAGEVVTVNNEEGGVDLDAYAYRFSDEALKQVYNTLIRYPFEVTGWTDTTVDGVVNTEKDGVLFTSIPYDKGWTVLLDGAEVETEKMFGAFLSFRVPSGTHTVSMRYVPQGLMTGAAVSGVSAAVVAAAALIGYVLRRRKKRLCGGEDADEE